MKQIEIVDSDLNKIQKSADKAESAVEDLTKDISKLGKEAKKADKSLDGLDDSIGDLSSSTTNFNDSQLDMLETMENVTRVTAGLVGTVEIVQGSLHLMGVESESVEKALQDMMAVMQVSQGLTDFADGIKSFKYLKDSIKGTTAAAKTSATAMTAVNTAAAAAATSTNIFGKAVLFVKGAFSKLMLVLKANPIMAIVTTLAAAGVALYKFASNSKETAKQQKALAEAEAKVAEATEDVYDAADKEYRLMKSKGVEEKEALKRKQQMLKAREAELRLHRLELHDRRSQGEKIDDSIFTNLDDQIKTIQKSISDLSTDIEIEANKAAREAADKAKEAADKVIAESKRAAEAVKQSRLNAQQQLTAKLKEYDNDYFEYHATEEEIQTRNLENKYKADADLFRTHLKNKLITQEQFNEFMVKLQRNLNEQRKKLIVDSDYKKFLDEHDDYIKKQQEDSAVIDYVANKRNNVMDETVAIYDILIDNELAYNQQVDAANLEIDKRKQLLSGLKSDAENWINLFSGSVDMSYFDDYVDKFKQTGLQDYQARIEAMSEMLRIKRDVTEAALANATYDNEKEKIQGDLDLYNQRIAVLTDLKFKILDSNAALRDFENELSNIKATAFVDAINQVKSSFNELQDIGALNPDAILSTKWNGVFDSITTGIEKVKQGFKDAEKAETKAGKGFMKYGQLATAGLSVASNMLQAIAEQQDESTEKGFEKQKKLQIAAVVMSTLSGIVDSWTSAMNPANAWMTYAGQLAVGSMMSGMIAATGIMNLKQIKALKFDGSDGGLAGVQATPSVNALSNLQQGIQYANVIEGSSHEGDIKDTRVYVVESDISNAQNKVRVSESEATF